MQANARRGICRRPSEALCRSVAVTCCYATLRGATRMSQS
ncbi:hypothetical protein EHQ23_06935 [Leptospira bourretii]|uniref:Uncharacterized protein n=1 Tax=Leptospira bourretii TaxID=2484962 RepID=A0A4R9IP52_9LEPT|nr:hypothetical protein EHQ23_06935 [Leptospira bourretii]TGK92248.1 hypothetical protein EHQ26_09735 [Leptospira bourretii]TGL18597.1 hypothetical protein EHQ47_17135 [Leptospira bourretii]